MLANLVLKLGGGIWGPSIKPEMFLLWRSLLRPVVEHGGFLPFGFTGLSRPTRFWLWQVSLPSCSAGCDWSELSFSQSQHHPSCMFTSPSGFLHKPQSHHDDSLQRFLPSYLKVTYLHMFSRHVGSFVWYANAKAFLLKYTPKCNAIYRFSSRQASFSAENNKY